jgi:peptidyl-prolyl cis-trans isomerase A (cyclophilin A)
MASRRIERRSLVIAGGVLAAAGFQARAQEERPKVAIRTGRGLIVVALENGKAPVTCANFLRYVAARAFDGGAIWRATRSIGAPKEGTIEGSPALKFHRFPPIAHESTTMTGLRHKTGSISLARYAPGSATADFFICVSDEPFLDAHPEAKGDNLGYAVFGEVVEGMDLVHRILAMHTVRNPSFPKDTPQILEPPVPILSMRRTA